MTEYHVLASEGRQRYTIYIIKKLKIYRGKKKKLTPQMKPHALQDCLQIRIYMSKFKAIFQTKLGHEPQGHVGSF
jgi:hypothetical protein